MKQFRQYCSHLSNWYVVFQLSETDAYGVLVHALKIDMP